MNPSVKILVIEDNPLDRKIIHAGLQHSNLNAIITFVDSFEGYRQEMKTGSPDIVISDYFMDGFNGMDVLEIHKKEAPDTPFIFITGQLQEETAIRCLEHGAQDYIMKDHLKRLPVSVKNALMLSKEQKAVRQKQKALEESEKRFRTLSEITFEGIAIHDNGKLLDCNLSFCKMFGYNREELLGKNIIELLVHPDDRNKVIENGRNNYTKPYESRGVKKGGTIFPIEQEAKEIENDGKRVRSVALRDISERKKTLEELKLSEEKFHKIANSATDAIVLIDHEGSISFWNNAAGELFGYKAEEVMGRNLHTFLATQKHYQAFATGFKEFRKTGKGNAVGRISEVEAVKKNGDIIPMELALSSINIHGQWHAAGILRDISKRKKTEQDMLSAQLYAEEMSKMKENFLITAGHELRTPLNGILGFTEIINDTLQDPQHNENLNMLYQSGQRMLRTVNLIVGLAELDSRYVVPHAKPENLAVLLEDICSDYAPEADSKNMYLNLQINVTDAIAEVDKTIFTNVITNLVDNAIKFTAVGGIVVKLVDKNLNGTEGFAISVSDTGIGIPEDKLPLIYNEFRQVSEGYNREFEGFGLGLHITKKYVDLMKGSITLTSLQGKGSEFTIFLPKNNSDSFLSITDISNTPVNESQNRSKPSILYVEDDYIHRLFMTNILQKDYLLTCVDSGPKALDVVKSKQFDLILMDINLGIEMNGLEVVKAIREMDSYKTVPIAAITANAMLSQKNIYLNSGCTDFLAKPFKKKQIYRLIEKNLIKSGYWD
jgi:PAS domain S-box-containing protein